MFPASRGTCNKTQKVPYPFSEVWSGLIASTEA
jgi:hypothetical protein